MIVRRANHVVHVRGAGLVVGTIGKETVRPGRILRSFHLAADFIATSDDWASRAPSRSPGSTPWASCPTRWCGSTSGNSEPRIATKDETVESPAGAGPSTWAPLLGCRAPWRRVDTGRSPMEEHNARRQEAGRHGRDDLVHDERRHRADRTAAALRAATTTTRSARGRSQRRTSAAAPPSRRPRARGPHPGVHRHRLTPLLTDGRACPAIGVRRSPRTWRRGTPGRGPRRVRQRPAVAVSARSSGAGSGASPLPWNTTLVAPASPRSRAEAPTTSASAPAGRSAGGST